MIFFPDTFIFSSPEPPKEKKRIYPLFIPFSGCKTRCIFCAQDRQTGCRAEAIDMVLSRVDQDLCQRADKGLPALELAFYGGTFTALDSNDFNACLAFVSKWQKLGMVNGVRCSTRPDALEPTRLAEMKDAGFRTVELGIQSFNDAVLASSCRGYTGTEALRGCELVLESGLSLGIQLMPGLPGMDESIFLHDVKNTIVSGPSYTRLYPCLVPEGTALAKLWRSGRYTTWEFEATVDVLAQASLSLWEAGISIIRIGVAYEPDFMKNVLAGPHNPCIGSMVRSKALYWYIREKLQAYYDEKGVSQVRLYVPKQWQGAFWGDSCGLESKYAELGLLRDNVKWCDGASFCLCPDCTPA